MILDIETAGTTELKEGDLIALNPEKRTIIFLRDGRPLLFSNGDDERIFPWGEAAFVDLIILLSNTHNFSSPPARLDEVDFSYTRIGGDRCISYRF